MVRAAIDTDDEITVVHTDWAREVFPVDPAPDGFEVASEEPAATHREERPNPSESSWPPCAC
jgi:hypothetical protein